MQTMPAVTAGARRARRIRLKSALATLATEKRLARRLFRRRLRSMDRRTDFEGVLPPTFTERDVW